MDVQLHLMQKQITLSNYAELFDSTTVWRHQTSGKRVQCILRDGLRPGGHADLRALGQIDSDFCKPTHFGVHVGGEFNMLPYPHKQYTVACDPVEILFGDKACQENARQTNDLDDMFFTGVYLSPMLNVHTWLRVIPTRLTFVSVTQGAQQPA